MKNKSTGQVPKIAKYRSSDVSAPYVLVCNYADTNSKIVSYICFTLELRLSFVFFSHYFSSDVVGPIGTEWAANDFEL